MAQAVRTYDVYMMKPEHRTKSDDSWMLTVRDMVNKWNEYENLTNGN